MQTKYDHIPSKEQANWLLFSAHKIEGVKGYLKKFPKTNEDKGCSATLMWSGVKDCNVPVKTFENQTVGFVLDATHLNVPQADSLAYRSGGQIREELLKSKASHSDGELGGSFKYTTKYPNKSGYYRHGMGQTIFVPNYARNEHLPGEKKSIYHEQGSAEVFAKNIWRKYFKRNRQGRDTKVMALNEAIVFQNKDTNPIAGLFITKTPTKANANELVKILEENKNLKLYLYDQQASEHIMRYLDNAEAQNYLNGFFIDSFKSQFAKATPYTGSLQANKVAQPQPVNSSLNWQILNGFIIALGIAAVVVAFVVLNAATCNALGVVIATVGIAMALTGTGFFAHNALKKTKQAEDVKIPDGVQLV